MERLRPISIMDKITPAQGEAWKMEHEALITPELAKGYYRAQASDIRRADLMERKKALYAQGDAQNELLDAIAEIQGRGQEIPIVTAKEMARSGSR